MRSENYTGMEVKLRRNKIDDAKHILGVRLVLDWGDDTEYLFRLDQANKVAGKMKPQPSIGMMLRSPTGNDG